VAGGGEGCARELFGVEAEGRLLGGVAVGWQCSFSPLERDGGIGVSRGRYLLQLRFPCSC
jgi:hypothetical protein